MITILCSPFYCLNHAFTMIHSACRNTQASSSGGGGSSRCIGSLIEVPSVYWSGWFIANCPLWDYCRNCLCRELITICFKLFSPRKLSSLYMIKTKSEWVWLTQLLQLLLPLRWTTTISGDKTHPKNCFHLCLLVHIESLVKRCMTEEKGTTTFN